MGSMTHAHVCMACGCRLRVRTRKFIEVLLERASRAEGDERAALKMQALNTAKDALKNKLLRQQQMQQRALGRMVGAASYRLPCIFCENNAACPVPLRLVWCESLCITAFACVLIWPPTMISQCWHFCLHACVRCGILSLAPMFHFNLFLWLCLQVESLQGTSFVATPSRSSNLLGGSESTQVPTYTLS